MELLLIGVSRFARRRVLPAAAALPGIERINVASTHARAHDLADVPKLGTVHPDWSRALALTRPGVVYVSLVNGDHARVVRQALDHGHHVVVDKPALPDPETAERLVALARSSSLVLAEATCYAFHPLFAAIRELLADLGAQVTTAVAAFTPPVPPDDWRHDRARGGGAVSDTGPYAVSLGRVLWGTEPERIEVVVGDRTADALETSYGMLAGYPGGRTVLGQFGFTSGYQNLVRLTGPGFAIEVERPFSAPPGTTVALHVQVGDQAYRRTVQPADSMREFLDEVLTATRTGSPAFGAALLSDARALARLRRAAAPPPDRGGTR
ncbi:Gfo/Idh/MocA family oxidoreductase [Kitasatospora viridis]|uniref:NDP-hexose-3-ketoreductase n=1 Tax=Kitasatospora viridis TaxID=281105 RepID=A0A561SFZ8_9ACTN|nr:Gfo/Idh/MocA family oxidoreductase [Kitasatospora viridis]TWF73794.1 NDP-hexose-3-ketoreductase [Kitasatospora viridis]